MSQKLTETESNELRSSMLSRTLSLALLQQTQAKLAEDAQKDETPSHALCGRKYWKKIRKQLPPTYTEGLPVTFNGFRVQFLKKLPKDEMHICNRAGIVIKILKLKSGAQE